MREGRSLVGTPPLHPAESARRPRDRRRRTAGTHARGVGERSRARRGSAERGSARSGWLGVGVLLEDRLAAEGLAAGLSDAFVGLFFDLVDQGAYSGVHSMLGLVAPAGDRRELEVELFGEAQLRHVLAASAGLVLGGAVEPETGELPALRVGFGRGGSRPLLGGLDEAFLAPLGQQTTAAVRPRPRALR